MFLNIMHPHEIDLHTVCKRSQTEGTGEAVLRVCMAREVADDAFS